MNKTKSFIGRTVIVLLMMLLELSTIYFLYRFFDEKVVWIEQILHIIGIFLVLFIVKNSKHLSSDLIWIIGITIFPIFGTLLYLVLGANLLTSKTFKAIISSTKNSAKYYKQDERVFENLEKAAPEIKGQFNYISKTAGYPFYENSGFDYYGLGDDGFPTMLKELKKAKKFIFIEYFIIEEGEMWSSILKILEEKALQGVDVRVMYDDAGSFFTLSIEYAKELEEKGIKCVPFNRINPIVGVIMNNRDHRKIMVIDGKVAFTGGINIADQYINLKKVHGLWKDNLVCIKGEAVWSYTLMFLTHWNALSKDKDEDYLKFKAKFRKGEVDGYIAPYGETPLDDELTSQNVYLNILNQASKYCYIFTPYLVIDTDFMNSLILAAKRGVDVRIITPGIPDKRIVWYITKSYYHSLIEGGVKIFEFTPGFVHSKVFVCDDKIATVGTINLDYRSLYLHFENGTYLYGSKKILDVKKDWIDSMKQSKEITLNECKNGLLEEFILSVLRLFAPFI